MKNQGNIWRSCADDRITDEAIENALGSKDQRVSRSTDQSALEFTTEDTPICAQYLTPIEPAEVTDMTHIYGSSGDCSLMSTGFGTECFSQSVSNHMLQSQTAEQHCYDQPQNDKPHLLQLGEGSTEPLTTNASSQSAPVDCHSSDLSLGYFTSEFDSEPKEDVCDQQAVQNASPDTASSIITDQFDIDSLLAQDLGIYTYSEQNVASSWNRNHDNEIYIPLDPVFYENRQQHTSRLDDAGSSPASDYSESVECNAIYPKTCSSSNKIAPTINHEKRLRSRGNRGGVGEHSRLIGFERHNRDSGRQKSLACPFQKKNSRDYKSCSKYTLRRIKDVKQHIYRHHCKPELYCPRCSQNFKSPTERDNHIRDAGCMLKEMPNPDGIITDNQRKELKNYKSRGMSIEQQWVELWKVIFPGAVPPRSPHIGNDHAEMLSCLRTYWDDNAGGIIARSLSEHEDKYPTRDLIRKAVGIILDHFESKSASWNDPTDIEASKA
ncbi:hypothetical protein F4777DRAFT_354452 [Nemania sp. FL0916]|nr:hypothetical protein F4777DRAFT_354452 [Nemania sp. FL0916]